MNKALNPSDLVNDEIRDLRGTKPELTASLWELMKSLALEKIKQELTNKLYQPVKPV